MIDPELEFGGLYSDIVVPKNLVSCDLDTLMEFPIDVDTGLKSNSPAYMYENENRFETEVLSTFYLCDKKNNRIGIEELPSSYDIFFRCYGLSIQTILLLGGILGCENPLTRCNGTSLNVDKVFKFSKSFTTKLSSLSSDELESLSSLWNDSVIAEYTISEEDRSVCVGSRYFYFSRQEFETTHFCSDFFSESLQDISEVCRSKVGMLSVFVAFTF